LQRLSLALPCFALFAVTGLPALETATARVTINVTEPTRGGVSGAQIRLIPSPAGSTAELATDDKGRISLELKPGGYGLFVSEPGFGRFVTHLEVQKSKEVQTIPIVLQIAPSGSPTVYPPSFKDALLLQALPYHEPVMLQPAELKALPHTKVTVHNPHTNVDETYSGLPLADLLTRVGAPLGKEFYGIALTSYIVTAGSGGDEALLALAEVDPSVHTGAVLVADTMDGHPLDAKSGPFKLVLTEDKRPVRSVRKLVSIDLKFRD
jgi:Carboxypeptidase regulatory-like domain